MDALSNEARALMRGADIQNDEFVIVSNNEAALEEIERHGYTHEIMATANPAYFICELTPQGIEKREGFLDAAIEGNN